MQKAPERKTGEDGLPVPPYAVYNIGNSHPENLTRVCRYLTTGTNQCRSIARRL